MSEENKEDLKKKLKLNTIIIGILIILLIVSVIFLIIKASNGGVKKENNISNLGMCVSGDNYIFYYKYEVGIIKIKDNTEYQISDDQAYSLNYYDGYLYYTTPNSSGGIDIKKISHNGEEEITLKSVSSSSTKMDLQDGYLYYSSLNPNTISKMDLNGENETIVITRAISDFEVEDETIYFTDEFGYLSKIDINGENYSQISDEVIGSKFQVYNGDAYYYEEENGLMKMDLDKADVKLVSDKVNSNVYNVTNKGIFYLDIDNLKICKISLNGKSYKELVDVNTSNTKINIIDNKLYYLETDEDNGIYKTCRIKINGKETDQVEY